MQKRMMYVLLGFLLFSSLLLAADRRMRLKKVQESLEIKISDETIEYGTELNPADLAVVKNGELRVEGELDTLKPGSYDLHFIVSGKDGKYDQITEKTCDVTVTVKDSQPPVIELRSDVVSIAISSSYDPLDNVKSVTDPVDGELDRETIRIETDADLKEAGEYQVKVLASDRNGLTAEKTFVLNVKEEHSLSADERRDFIWQQLIGRYGYSKAAACGIMSNISSESGFDPSAGEEYYGLCQWGGDRKNDLFNYCGERGLSPYSLDGQLAFMENELNGSYAAVKDYLRRCDDSQQGAYDAAVFFCDNYEGAESSQGRGEQAMIYYGIYQ